MPIWTRETEMSGHRRSSSSSSRSAHRTSVPISSHHRRQFKRPSAGTSSVGTRASCPSWAILNAVVARRDGFHGDRTTSAVSRTFGGEAISASFHLVDPPGTSVLTLDMPDGGGSPEPMTQSYLHVLAADGDFVLFGMRRYPKDSPSVDRLDDYFVYKASSDASRRPTLSLLPAHYDEKRYYLSGPEQHNLERAGILSCSSNESSPAFIVADLLKNSHGRSAAVDVCLYRSVSDKWEVFKNLHVHGTDGGRALRWWSTDAVVPYRRRRFLIWVDYYRGMIVADMSPPLPPKLRYVPLPVGTVPNNDPDDREHGRGIPESSRSLCATRSGVKFVSVDRQHTSNWGVGHTHMLTWKQTFRITTWSLRDGDYTWRKDATMYEEEFWAALGSDGRFFPHVEPEFPVVNMENPDAVCFQLREEDDDDDRPWVMVEVDVKKKALLAFTTYSKDTSLSGDRQDAITAARIESQECTFISSELPRYLNGEQACKKRRRY